MRVLVLAAVGVLLAGCGGPGACPVPTGCVRAERVKASCTCAEWETVSTETLALPFVLIGMAYRPVGSGSVFCYGVTRDPAMVPHSSSSSGTAARAVIRRPGAAEQIARVGVLAYRAPLERVSDTALRIWRYTGIDTFTAGGVDLPTPGSDWIVLWTNAVATLRTTYAGEEIVDWAVGSRCFEPRLDCTAGEPMPLSPRLIRGEVSRTAAEEAFLASLTPDERGALLAFDPREAGGTIGPPRYELVAGDVPVGPAVFAPDATWDPCTGPFEVLAETAVSLASGGTFVVQYGVQSDGTCEPQRPGVLLGSTTPGCAMDGRLFIDRLSGTLLLQPGDTPPACTTR